MPRMLHEIVEAMVSSQPDMTVAAQVNGSESIAAAARRVRADLVILSESKDEPGQTLWQVLDEHPRLKLMTISSDGQRATRCELRPHRVVIDDISCDKLINAVRAAIADRE
jgi:DNA-binding NarL/FixJ family response regulator